MPLHLTLLPEVFAVCRLEPTAKVPNWAHYETVFSSITRTRDELSIVCTQESVPEGIQVERDWRRIRQIICARAQI